MDIEKHFGYITNLCRKFGAENPVMDSEQWSVAILGIANGLACYDPARSSESTFVHYCVTYALIKWQKQERNRIKPVSLSANNTSHDHDWEPEDKRQVYPT